MDPVMPEPAPDMLAAALAAWDAGLCVVRAKADGSKRPDGEWRQYQSQRPTREQVAEWFKNGHPAMGTVCGTVSGNLEMFELEGRFMEKYPSTDFKQRMTAAGLELLLARMSSGIATQSPSGGWHFLYRVADGTVDGNSKLAGTADSLTLIETRGEGGFVMLPPSHGTTHPSGKPWKLFKGGYASIPTITAEEREALFDVARSYDESPAIAPPPPVAPGQRVAHQRHTTGYNDSWIAMVEEHLVATWDLQQLLERYGWSFCYQDAHGRRLVHRPGKDGDGVGGSINLSDRFHPFSSSTPFPGASAGKKAPTWDRAGVIAIYEYGGDRMAALNEIARTTGIMDAWKEHRDRENAEALQIAIHQPSQEVDTPNLNKSTGEIEAPNHDDLWEEREVFRHIKQAARSRLVSPYAVLGCVLARVAAFTPPTVCLPPIIGGTSPLSLFIALQGASGEGKSSPVECAASLLPDIPEGCKGPEGIGSGEGVIEAFLRRVEKKCDDGKTRRVLEQEFRGVLFTIDEGQILEDLGSRKGATILPILRTAWSGTAIGQANASEDTKRSLKAKSYAIGLISLWQDDAGVNLLADVVGGTPQRFIWIPTADASLERKVIPWPGALNWTPPNFNRMGDILFHEHLHVPEDIIDQLRNDRWDILQRVVKINPLDSHRNLNKLRLAGILAVLESRREITHDDWRIAERIMCISDATRDMLADRGAQKAAETLRVDAVKHSFREAILEQSATERALKNAAKAAWKCATNAPDGATRRDISRRIASRDRALVSVDDALAYALAYKWIEGSDALNYRPGEHQPSIT